MKRLASVALVLFAISLACGATRVGTPTPPIATNTPGARGSLDLQWEYSTSPFMPLSVQKDALGRPYLYVAQQQGGLLILDISNRGQPTKVGVVPKSQLAGLAAMYVTQKQDVLYLALGNFFAAEGA